MVFRSLPSGVGRVSEARLRADKRGVVLPCYPEGVRLLLSGRQEPHLEPSSRDAGSPRENGVTRVWGTAGQRPASDPARRPATKRLFPRPVHRGGALRCLTDIQTPLTRALNMPRGSSGSELEGSRCCWAWRQGVGGNESKPAAPPPPHVPCDLRLTTEREGPTTP